MLDKCQITASEIARLNIINEENLSAMISKNSTLKVSRLIVTDNMGIAIYDSLQENNAVGNYILLPEIADSLSGNDVFSWNYHDGVMQSCSAVPITTYGALIGCVYMMEFDTQQGALIDSLQRNILFISIILEVVIILFSLSFSSVITGRLRRIMDSMRTIREGDYSHKVKMGGNDELTVLENEFNNLTERLQISEQKRQRFVSDASHELKTPLASIKLLTDSILQNEMDMETIKEFVSDIGNEADRLNRMSRKLLSLSHIESQADSDCEIVNLAPTIERVMRMLSTVAKEQNITISQNILEDCPILVLEDDLYQIIFNLVENGIKYNTPGGSLTIKLSRQKDNAVLQVMDTGVGIPEDAIVHIYERFFRVDKARARKSGGSGLGLAIVRNMVERNRGEIFVESTVGKGTTFTITFPVFDIEEDAQ